MMAPELYPHGLHSELYREKVGVAAPPGIPRDDMIAAISKAYAAAEFGYDY